jgi:predicted metal-dependent HD superfamily phosphohydrolase
MSPLDISWNTAWKSLAVDPPLGLVEALRRRYEEPHRKYHTLQHLGECLALAGRDGILAEHPAEVVIALWFHDAVYDLHRHDNEAASAAWAREALREAGVRAEIVDRVDALVMATRHRAEPPPGDARLVVDIDLAILGAERARFDEYELQIRDEYAHVPPDLFHTKRRAILQSFLDRPAIYGTPVYRERFEAKARENLARAVAADAPRPTAESRAG